MAGKDNSESTGWIKHMAGIVKEVGLLGFITLFVAFIFLFFSTLEQKQEFVDRFILLKDGDKNPFPCAMIVLCLFVIILIGGMYNSRMLKLRKEENNRIGKEKSDLQKRLLEKDLNSSA